MADSVDKPADDDAAEKPAKKKRAKKKAKKKSAKKKQSKKLDLNDPTAVIQAIVSAAQKKVTDLDVGSAGPPVVFFDTGSYALNWCLSNLAVTGGVPGGRVVEIFGDPSTGKSLVIYKIMAHVTTGRGGYVILDDTEGCYMEPYAAKLGVDIKRVIPLDSDTVEEHFARVLELIAKTRALIGPRVPLLVALDSLALLRTEHEATTPIEKRDLTKASLVRKGMRQLRIAMRRDGYTSYVVANHVIANIGDRYKPRTTPGGKAVPFQCSARIELQLRGKVREEKTNRVLGVETFANVVKNKIIEPFRSCHLRIMYKTGLVPTFGLYEVAKLAGIVKPTKSEGWYRMDGVKKKFQQKTFYDKHLDRALALFDLQQPPGPPQVEPDDDDDDDVDGEADAVATPQNP